MSSIYLIFSALWITALCCLSIYFFKFSKKLHAVEIPLQLLGFSFFGFAVGYAFYTTHINPWLLSAFSLTEEIHYIRVSSNAIAALSIFLLVFGLIKLLNILQKQYLIEKSVDGLHEQVLHQNQLLSEQSRDLEIRTIDYLEQREAAIEADRSKTDFLRNASHEVRTPLNAIIGLSELIAAGNVKDEQEQKEFAQMVIDSGRKLLKIFETLLEISRLKSDEYVANPQPANIRGIIDECVALCLPRAHAKNMSFVHVPENDEGIYAVFDKKATYQILIRLIGNALTYSPEMTSVTITIDHSNSDFTQIKISDEGPGIEPQHIKNAFELFGRAENWQHRGTESTGLGLALSVKMANIQDAKLEIESDGNSGTTCILSLPAHESSARKAS
ncbi:hypothetical protein A9Q83_03035 [Alphaproteobacteria bacterium 46_93_T64]|nr:hypothetical protein A9Q83_03035 [Alphaproteobacteria bacterium 46_93_T64]